MLLPLLLDALTAMSEGVVELCYAAGLLVRLRPEFAGAYPRVPAGRWLPAYRREGEAGVVYLDQGGDDAALPLFEPHLDIRAPEGEAPQE